MHAATCGLKRLVSALDVWSMTQHACEYPVCRNDGERTVVTGGRDALATGGISRTALVAFFSGIIINFGVYLSKVDGELRK